MPLSLLLAFHNHQPEGNFGEVFAQAYEDCYRPLLLLLGDHPHVKVALHHTGALLEWIEKERPEYGPRLRALVERGQVELLGGGFYEPMLAVLPERDARGQIALMSEYLEAHFGARPRGMWLAERVWEPSLAKLIADAGMRFTLVDDGHFRAAGIEGRLRGYYVTEKAGTPLALFPIDKTLRDAIPFRQAHETLETIERLGAESAELGDPEAAVTYGDDGEKFGVWPKTKEWVWGQGWLRQFFQLLAERRDRVVTRTFSEYLAMRRPTGRVYLPTASYEEMGEWTLPADAQRRYLEVRSALEARGELDRARAFIHGGIWQGFLAKYPEANLLHKKMIDVSDKVAAAATRDGRDQGRVDLATQELYRAQCNCCYWHGLFGGLYLNYLRDAAYRHLLVAEAFADAELGRPAPRWAGGRSDAVMVEARDVDADLSDEIVIQSAEIDLVARPADGGTVQELAFRDKTFMLTNVLSRQPEGYHDRLRAFIAQGGAHEGGAPKSIHDLVEVKEPGLDRYLVYDRGPRRGFIDHFLADDTTLDTFAAGAHEELGDFVDATYARLAAASPARAGIIALERSGTVAGRPLHLGKTIEVHARTGGAPARLRVRYQLAARGEPLTVIFAPELSLTLLDGRSPERGYRLPDRDLPPEDRLLSSRGTFAEVPSLALYNEANRFRVELDFCGARPEVWRFPLETVSNSEAGFERTYQGSVIVPRFRLTLNHGACADVVIELRLVET
jgi:alpha-amylase